jgi:hypothetical protein
MCIMPPSPLLLVLKWWEERGHYASKYGELDSLGTQEFKWDKGVIDPAYDYIFS